METSARRPRAWAFRLVPASRAAMHRRFTVAPCGEVWSLVKRCLRRNGVKSPRAAYVQCTRSIYMGTADHAGKKWRHWNGSPGWTKREDSRRTRLGSTGIIEADFEDVSNPNRRPTASPKSIP